MRRFYELCVSLCFVSALYGVLVLAKVGDAEGTTEHLVDIETVEGEETHAQSGIAVVGNGPISQANFDAIQTHREVWMFNDMKNKASDRSGFNDPTKVTTWVIREMGETPGKVGGDSFLQQPKAPRPGYAPPPIDYNLHQRKLKHANLSSVLVVSQWSVLVEELRRANPTKIDFAPVHESRLKHSPFRWTNLTFDNEKVTFGGCVEYLHSETGCGPSTGTVALDFIFKQRSAGKIPTSTWVHIYGMNWAFHETFLTCCGPTSLPEFKDEQCCDDCHNFDKERAIIKQCCTAANRCVIHKTPTAGYNPLESVRKLSAQYWAEKEGGTRRPSSAPTKPTGRCGEEGSVEKSGRAVEEYY
jgi:hypothetical protein